jgi:hypothetical protein
MEHQTLHRQSGKDAGHAIRHPVHFYCLCEQKDQVEVLKMNVQSDFQLANLKVRRVSHIST